MKIVSIVGARPQFIKLAPLSSELRKKHNEIIVHTGQHYNDELSKLFFDDLGIPKPDYNLNIGSGSHGFQTAEILKKTEEILVKENPDLVIVFGDTNSTMGGTLASSKLKIKIAHVEAGLRSFDKTMPEEINRVLTDHCSDILFCPTKTAVENLENEGITENVFNVGDVMYDALLNNIKLAQEKSTIIERLDLDKESYMLATLHRASNVDDKKNLKTILDALSESQEKIILPLHPRTRKMIKEFNLEDKIKKSNINITPPVGYLDMLVLEENAKKILTDSGGIQKEAYLLGIPCVTLRENTEWIETLFNGCNVLVGSNKDKILEEIKNNKPFKGDINLYGDGNASHKITELLKKYC